MNPRALLGLIPKSQRASTVTVTERTRAETSITFGRTAALGTRTIGAGGLERA
ncbi:hypothetical protein GCM10029978_069800 [Actinoallomurus acanthiterrae]